jgi:hypothetical protein
MSLNKLFDFIHILYSIRKYHTKIEHFYKHILFSIIHLLQEHELNHRNYYQQELNMGNFAQANEHGVHMYAKFQY